MKRHLEVSGGSRCGAGGWRLPLESWIHAQPDMQCGSCWNLLMGISTRPARLAAEDVAIARSIAPDAPVDDEALEFFWLAGYAQAMDDALVGSQRKPPAESEPPEIDLDLLRKLASGEGGRRTGALKRAGLVAWTITAEGRKMLVLGPKP